MLQKQDTALTLFIILQIVQLQFQCSYHPSTPIRLNKHFFSGLDLFMVIN